MKNNCFSEWILLCARAGACARYAFGKLLWLLGELKSGIHTDTAFKVLPKYDSQLTPKTNIAETLRFVKRNFTGGSGSRTPIAFAILRSQLSPFHRYGSTLRLFRTLQTLVRILSRVNHHVKLALSRITWTVFDGLYTIRTTRTRVQKRVRQLRLYKRHSMWLPPYFSICKDAMSRTPATIIPAMAKWAETVSGLNKYPIGTLINIASPNFSTISASLLRCLSVSFTCNEYNRIEVSSQA